MDNRCFQISRLAPIRRDPRMRRPQPIQLPVDISDGISPHSASLISTGHPVRAPMAMIA
jgi:hypothetical protein